MPYDYLTINEVELNKGIVTASYFDTNLQKLYEQTTIGEPGYFGGADDDVIEFSLYDGNQNLIRFNRILPKVTYSITEGSFRDINNNLTSYRYIDPNTNLVRYFDQVLVHSQADLKINEVTPGLYYLLYNCIKNIAGNPNNKLVIKEVSPSRTEIRLSFAYDPTKNEQNRIDAIKVTAFADKKYLPLQINDVLVPLVQNNPIERDFAANETQFNLYQLCQNLGLKTKAELQEFINSTYRGFDKVINTSDGQSDVVQIKKFIGVSQQIVNFLYKYNDTEFTADELLESIRIIVLKVSQDRILERTSLNPNSLQSILEFFLKIIYTDWLLPETTKLLNEYSQNFYSFYKNALNFDNGNLIKIINHASYLNTVDNRINIQLKLDSPLPLEYDVKSFCWISNISIAPVYFKTNLFTQQLSRKVFLNGVNFTVEVPTVYASNQEYLNHDGNTLSYAKVRLKQKVNDLYINFNSFEDFINYSSAELRTKIAKNKIVNYQKLETEKQLLENTAKTAVYSVSSSYSAEVSRKIQSQINLLDSLDDYESYLFFNTSSIDDKIDEGIEFDKSNYNSLIYQLPEYVKTDVDSADYIKFTAMVGHFFDNILVYIKKFPKNYPISNNDGNHYPKNYIEELLNSLNWNFDIAKFEQSNINQLYFNQTEYSGSLSSSYFDYAKSILNRLTNNLSSIYKSKGSTTSFELLRSIFGISPEILQIKEYGNSDVITNQNSFYVFDDIVYMTNFKENNYIFLNHTGSDFVYNVNEFVITSSVHPGHFTRSLEVSTEYVGISSLEFAFKIDENSQNYSLNNKIPLVTKNRLTNDWKIYIKKTQGSKLGKLVFDFNPIEIGNATTSSLVLDELPLLNGNIYSVLLRREIVPGYEFDKPLISSSFEKNEVISKILENQPSFNNFVIEDDSDFVILFPPTASVSASYFIDNTQKYIPYNYTLTVNQYDGSQKLFSEKKQKVLTYEFNRRFSSGSYFFGNYSSSVSFIGNLDKIKVYKSPLADDDFEEHSYNLDSISIPEKSEIYKNLFYLWSFDTPINLYDASSIKSVDNQSQRYQSTKFYAFNFLKEPKYFGAPTCSYVDVSEFPYQFDKIEVKQSINVNNYGPNFAINNKINKVNEEVSSNLVPYDYSSYTNDIYGSDSNLASLTFSPYTYLNNKIENFLGKEGIMDIIGDPKYLTNQTYYPTLNRILNEFKIFNNKYIYPQEFYSTYKFYIDFSIFDFAKNLVPSRTNLLTGLLLQPSIFERKKFNYKDVKFNVDEELSIYFNNKGTLTSSLFNTNDITNKTTVNCSDKLNVYKTDHNTYNFSMLEIKDKVDDRDFIYCKYGKVVNINDNGFVIRETPLVESSDYYQLVNNKIKNPIINNGSNGTSGTAGSSGSGGVSGGEVSNYICTFTSSYSKVEIVGSGSGYTFLPNGSSGTSGTGGSSGTGGTSIVGFGKQVTGSRVLRNLYTGENNSGYSRRHLSKFTFAGSRSNYIAISGSNYSIISGVKLKNTPQTSRITYYKYTKSKNDTSSTVNRQGINNGSSPIIIIPGFLSVDIESNNFNKFGYLTGSIGSPNSIFVQQPITCSTCASASLKNYIMNL